MYQKTKVRSISALLTASAALAGLGAVGQAQTTLSNPPACFLPTVPEASVKCRYENAQFVVAGMVERGVGGCQRLAAENELDSGRFDP